MQPRHTKLVAAALVLMLAMGCSTGNVLSAIGAWLPTGLNAFQTIISILSIAGAINPGSASAIDKDVVLVTKDFADIQALYQSYVAAPKGTMTIDKIVAAIRVIQLDLNTLETDSHLTDPRAQAVIAATIGLMLTTLSAIEANLPSVGGQTLAQQVPVKPPVPSVRSFKAQFNQIMLSHGYPEKVMH